MIFTRGFSMPRPARNSRKRSYIRGPPACSWLVISVAVTMGRSPRSCRSRIARTALSKTPAPRTLSFISGSVSSRLTRISSEYAALRASAASRSAMASSMSVPLVSTVVGATASASRQERQDLAVEEGLAAREVDLLDAEQVGLSDGLARDLGRDGLEPGVVGA